MSSVGGNTFLGEVSPRVRYLMQALAAAESLTDNVARQILVVLGVPPERADTFLDLLHCADYVVPRNSEWCFAHEVRAALRDSAREEQVQLQEVHSVLLRIGREGNPEFAGDLIPAYLFTQTGEAYHSAEMGHAEEALQRYANAAYVHDGGELWLAGTLSQEQQRAGTLAADAVEPTFLRALSAYRDNDIERAYPGFLLVADSGKLTELVAWALQLAGEIEIGRRQLQDALEHLRRAVDLFETLRSWKKLVWALASRAMVLDLLGRPEDALADLKRAISMCTGDWRARLLWRVAGIEHKRHNLDDALAALDEAENCAERLRAVVLVQRAGLMRERGDPVGALRDADRAVEIASPDKLASALNTRGSIYWELGRWTEAKKDLISSLKISKDSTTAAALNTLACIHRDEGDLEASLAYDQAVREMPPRQRRAMNMRIVDARSAQVRAEQQALAQAVTAADLDSFWFKHFTLGARAAFNARAWHRAAELFRRAQPHARSAEQLLTCLRGIGFAFEKTIDAKAQAVEPLLQAVRIAPRDSVALATLARVLDLLGHPLDEVAPYFLRAIEANRGNFWAPSWYALALSRAGRHEEAIQFAELGLGGKPHAARLFNLAVVLDASPDLADRHRALEYAKQAVSIAETGFDAPARFVAGRGER